MTEAVTSRARELISRDIHSVEQLEVLLLLRAAPEKAWSAADVARALITSTDSAAIRLEDLEQRGFTQRSADGWRYRPAAALNEAVSDLARAYASHRVTVVGLIFSKPSDAVRGFSDAFRLRGGG